MNSEQETQEEVPPTNQQQQDQDYEDPRNLIEILNDLDVSERRRYIPYLRYLRTSDEHYGREE